MKSERAVVNVLQGLLVVFCGSILVWMLLGFPKTGIDDADIFLVYADHFSSGHGFVYNIGGERVEGFTSMLWTLICSFFFLFGNSVESLLYLVNVLLGTLAVYACLRRTRRPGFFLLLLLASPAWFAWCQVTLMETGLWCLLITLLGLAVMEQRRAAVCLLLPLLVLTRPESMMLGAWAILLLGGQAPKGSRLASVGYPILAFGGSLLLLVAFRIWYFGYPVPNTFYAKVSPNGLQNMLYGSLYLLGYLVSCVGVAFALICWLRVLIRRRRHEDLVLALFLLPGIGIPLLVGGDHFGGFRFYQPLWPLLCLLAVRQLPHPASRRMITAVVCITLSGWLVFPFTARLAHEFRIAAEGRSNGAALTHIFGGLDAWPTVGVITAGGNKLAYPGPVLDLMGLNWIEMAHAEAEERVYKNHSGFSREVFYRWQPDILLCGDSPEFDFLVLKGLHDESRFRAEYERHTLHRNEKTLNAYFRSDFLRELSESDKNIKISD